MLTKVPKQLTYLNTCRTYISPSLGGKLRIRKKSSQTPINFHVVRAFNNTDLTQHRYKQAYSEAFIPIVIPYIIKHNIKSSLNSDKFTFRFRRIKRSLTNLRIFNSGTLNLENYAFGEITAYVLQKLLERLQIRSSFSLTITSMHP